MHEFYQTWDASSLAALTDHLKQYVYDKYVLKCKVFQRDNFECQNAECNSPDISLTLHHVKFQKNKGEHKVRNCVTICKTCHKGYHRAKRPLIFLATAMHLPSHMKGHKFKVSKPEKQVDWKKVKAEMKAFRKKLKAQGVKTAISWDQIVELFRWLFMSVEEYDDDLE